MPDAILARQRAAFMHSGFPDAAARQSDLLKLEHAVHANQDIIAGTISADFGNRSRAETVLSEILPVIAACRHARRHVASWMRPRRRAVGLNFKPATNRVTYTPKGVIGVVSPWNYPIFLTLGPLVDILAAGNGCMIKPSELTPATGALLAKLLADIFSPEQVAVVQGDVAIGRALMRDAACYLMDDPISALDARLREETRVELKRLQREIGHTLIYVTHDQEEAMSVADRMAILEAGSIRQIDTPQAIYDAPNCRYVAALIGAPSMNFIPGAIVADRFQADGLAWALPVSLATGPTPAQVEIAFRPEDAMLGRGEAGEGLNGAVLSVEPLGAFTVVVVACGPHAVKALLTGQPRFSIGEPVAIAVAPERRLFFDRADGRRIGAEARVSESV